MRPRASLKEVRHLEEKSSRGFRFLRHRHKHKVLLQYRDPPQKQKIWRISTADASTPKRNPAPSVNPGTGQLWQTNCDTSANGGTPETERCSAQRSTSATKSDRSRQRRDLPQKQSLRDLDSKETHLRNQKSDGSQQSWKQSNYDLTPPTTDTRQMVRATASSPFDKPHLRTLSIVERSTSETKSDGPQQKGIHSRKTRTKPHNQWVWWKHPKIVPLTVALMLLQHKRLTVSNMLLQKRDPPRNSNGSQPLNASVKAWQQQHNGSIWCTTNKQNTAQHRDPLQKQIGWNSQKQLPVPINHLKEEPSAPQSLSIFDST